MIFFAHENFPAAAGVLLQAFDGDNTFELFPYPPGTPQQERVPLVGKRNPKPFIMTFDDGMLVNKVQRSLLRESGCHYVYFSRGWSKTDWPTVAWKLIKCWPSVVKSARSTQRQSVLEVALNGKVVLEVL